MTSGDLPAGRDLDALIAEKVMGHRVLEKRPVAIFVEGEWSIHLDSENPEDWSCYAERAPVYVREDCRCQEPIMMPDDLEPEKRETFRVVYDNWEEKRQSDVANFGHQSLCLTVVPEYSTSISAAWEVVEKIRSLGRIAPRWEIESTNAPPSGWIARIYGMQAGEWQAPELGFGDTLPLAVCRAALKAVEAPQET